MYERYRFLHIVYTCINVCALYQYPVNDFLILQNGLEECCKAVAKRQIDGDELLVSALLYYYEKRRYELLPFQTIFVSSVNSCLADASVSDLQVARIYRLP